MNIATIDLKQTKRLKSIKTKLIYDQIFVTKSVAAENGLQKNYISLNAAMMLLRIPNKNQTEQED